MTESFHKPPHRRRPSFSSWKFRLGLRLAQSSPPQPLLAQRLASRGQRRRPPSPSLSPTQLAAVSARVDDSAGWQRLGAAVHERDAAEVQSLYSDALEA